LGSVVHGPTAHRIARGEVHPTSLASVSPAKLAASPGTARGSPPGGTRRKLRNVRGGREPTDPTQRSLIGLFAGGVVKHARCGRSALKAAPRLTPAVAGLVGAIASCSKGGLDSPTQPLKSSPRMLWGGLPTKPTATAAPTHSTKADLSAASHSTVVGPTLPPELADLFTSSPTTLTSSMALAPPAQAQHGSGLAAAFHCSHQQLPPAQAQHGSGLAAAFHCSHQLLRSAVVEADCLAGLPSRSQGLKQGARGGNASEEASSDDDGVELVESPAARRGGCKRGRGAGTPHTQAAAKPHTSHGTRSIASFFTPTAKA
jgi:hypothetical protein